jgi:hypothetical protein
MSETDFIEKLDSVKEKYQLRVEKLANALGIRLSKARKMLNSQAADRLFETNEALQEWERKNFPDSKNH